MSDDKQEFRKGDKVWDCILDDWGSVTINKDTTNTDYPIIVEFKNSRVREAYTYTKDGRLWTGDTRPRLYFDRFDFPPPPPRPKRRVKKTGWINIYPHGTGHVIYDSYEEARDNAGKDVVDTVQVIYHVEE